MELDKKKILISDFICCSFPTIGFLFLGTILLCCTHLYFHHELWHWARLVFSTGIV